ncbi:hypothetical protein [Paraburkholderia hayleyella]|uniref:hypothetical protein n=1 Tax=Paraburkholderia hayleyella TaxID=2152889 RepID=UPI0012926A2D|nr:hypothetical protein [Paraburkholderia hayleyella]
MNSSDDLNKKIKQVNQGDEQRARVEENKLNNLPFNLQKIIIGEVLLDPGADREEYFFKNLAEFKLLSKKFNYEFSKNLWDASAKDQVWHATSAPGVVGKLSEQCINRELQKGLPEAELRKNILKIMRFFPHVRIQLSPDKSMHHNKIMLDLMLNEVFLEQNKFELIASGRPEVISSIIQKLMSSKTLVESGRLIGLNLTSTSPLESPALPILNPVWLLSHKNLKTLNLKRIELCKPSRELEVQPDQPIVLEDVDLLDCFMMQDEATCFAKCEALISFKISEVNVSDILLLGLAGMKNLKTLFMNKCFLGQDDYRVRDGFSSLNVLSLKNSIFHGNAIDVMFRGAALTDIDASIHTVFDGRRDIKMSGELFSRSIITILADGGLKCLKNFDALGMKITQPCLNGLSELKHLKNLRLGKPDTVGIDGLKEFIEKSEELKQLVMNDCQDLDLSSRTELVSWSTRLRPGFKLDFYPRMDS